MANGIDDDRGQLGREQSGGSAGKQNPNRADSDRDYGARDGGAQPGADRGDSAPKGSDLPNQYEGTGGSRTDNFGGRSDQQHDDKAGWRSVGGANPEGLIGGEDEKPGDGDPLGAGVR